MAGGAGVDFTFSPVSLSIHNTAVCRSPIERVRQAQVNGQVYARDIAREELWLRARYYSSTRAILRS